MDRVLKDPKLQELWIRRVIAFVIDAIIIGLAVGILYALLFFSTAFAFNSFGFLEFGFLFPGLTSVLLFFYFTLLDFVNGRTFGKMVLELRVITTDGTKLDLARSFLRNVSKLYWLLLVLDIIGGFVTQVEPGQKYSDHLARTNVTTARS
ncbi:MAG: RDD family protein [Thaumarchaeota archaeon]|nr:RDD family protein [Nitrososphaerota archaeon]